MEHMLQHGQHNKLAALIGIIALLKYGLLDRLPKNGIRLNIPVWLFSSFILYLCKFIHD
jgi:hypothetical protein